MTASDPGRALRLWPGVAIVALQLIALYLPGYFAPATPLMFFGMMGSFTVGTLLLRPFRFSPRVTPRLGRPEVVRSACLGS